MIKKVHYISGITISLFVGLHLFNHVYSIFGVSQHIELMDSLRVVYRNVVVETILLMAVVVQIISGLRLFTAKRKTVATFFEKLQIWSGLYLAFFLMLHVGAVLSGRFLFGLDTNFYFGVAGLNTFPFSLFFVPYYGLAILAFFSHIAAIHAQKMKRSLLGISPNTQSNLILTLGFVFTFLIFYGLTNGFQGVAIPEAYDILIGK